MISIDMYAYRSKFKAIDPMVKLFFAFLTLFVCLWAGNGIISTSVILMMGFLTVLKGGTPFRFYVKLLRVPVVFLVMGVSVIAIQVSKEADALVGAFYAVGIWVGFSQTGLQDGLMLFLKALGAVSCLYFLSLSTPMVDILACLRKLRIPTLLVEMMGLVYRAIFVLMETADTIIHAQNCRLGYASLTTAYRSLGSLASMLFIRSYIRANMLYTALEARGYEGELQVYLEDYPRWRIGYIMATAVNLLFIGTFLALSGYPGGFVR